ncbi:YveK family protein [Vagococcus xieshaowenii]|uniref:Capsular polysaccharide biosynthesis protein CpsC n=1 Tax=Vagococcus xieshaowenii TaxID=2562451 RepID=A0A4Z0DE90_9ENTE|nr:Wzz/FepE/Etk N-terminal domain-containing protein [Vagococcus xieshaowenii]QCA29254.1 hypothetical protein E4Z98_07955 [Vagococcus xieshaowenii]TFZ43192.1 hypothetical protein E4031_00770 [Vagococcus xieshaowenii]
MEQTISIEELIKIIKNRWLLILSLGIIGCGIAALVTQFLMDEKYSSSAQMIADLPELSKDQDDTDLEDVNFNLQMINTYKDIISSEKLLEEVRLELKQSYGINKSIESIRSQSEVVQNTNSQMFAIKVTANSPEEAQTIANVQSKEFIETSQAVPAINNVSIFSEATLKKAPVGPNLKLNILIGTMLGLLMGLGITFLLEFMDKTASSVDFIEDQLNLPNLGSVYQMTEEQATYNPYLLEKKIVV